MRTSRFSNEQIVQALRQAETGTPVIDIDRDGKTDQARQQEDDARIVARYDKEKNASGDFVSLAIRRR